MRYRRGEVNEIYEGLSDKIINTLSELVSNWQSMLIGEGVVEVVTEKSNAHDWILLVLAPPGSIARGAADNVSIRCPWTETISIQYIDLPDL